MGNITLSFTVQGDSEGYVTFARIVDQNLSCKQEKSKVMKNLFWNCSAPTADLQKRNPHSGQKMFVTKLERWPRTI